MPKQGKHSLQGSGKKLLKSASGGGLKITTNTATNPAASKNKHGVAASKAKSSRKELDKQVAALRERQIAKNFKRAPQTKVVLAAPIFDLPSQRDQLLQPQQHPMDAFLQGERDERRRPQPSQEETNFFGSTTASGSTTEGNRSSEGNRFSSLETEQHPSPLRITLQPSILAYKPLSGQEGEPDYSDL